MFRIRNAALVMTSMLTVASISAVRAQSQPNVDDKVVQSVCRAVMTAARPSTFKQNLDIAPYELKIIDERRIDVTFVVKWKGSVSSGSYQSRFTFKVYLADKKIEVVGLTYTDTAKHWRWSQANLDRLVLVSNDLLEVLLRE